MRPVIKLASVRIITLISVFAFIVASVPSVASAAQIQNRKMVISSAAASATGVTYTFTSDALPTGTAVKSLAIAMCTTASGTCTPASGFSSTGTGTLPSQPTGLGATSGWSADASSAGSLRIVNASNATVPSGSVSITWNNVTNPSTANATFYARVTAYSASNWTGALDTGVVALATSGIVTVTANVDETLTFTLASTTVSLGTLSASSTASGTSSITAATNASHGYSINVVGNTLMSGTEDINVLAGASSIGSEQFGINLAANTTPAIGSAISGSGSLAGVNGYGTANSFKFTNGDKIAETLLPSNSNTATVSYIANIAGNTPAGAYSTQLNYVAVANF